MTHDNERKLIVEGDLCSCSYGLGKNNYSYDDCVALGSDSLASVDGFSPQLHGCLVDCHNGVIGVSQATSIGNVDGKGWVREGDPIIVPNGQGVHTKVRSKASMS